MSADHSVQGYCPMCGRKGLFLGSGGHITCSQSDTVRHPLRERLNEELMDRGPAWAASITRSLSRGVGRPIAALRLGRGAGVRAIVARLRGPRLSPGERVMQALDEPRDLSAPPWSPRRVYDGAVTEAFDQCVKLGLDPNPVAEHDVAELIRYAYKEGWLACESRLAAPNMADAIDLAITTPAAVVERNAGESEHRWTIRAIQHAVAHGVTSEREAAG